jgi:hypothetical protein
MLQIQKRLRVATFASALILAASALSASPAWATRHGGGGRVWQRPGSQPALRNDVHVDAGVPLKRAAGDQSLMG